jgi:hypothetical protein
MARHVFTREECQRGKRASAELCKVDFTHDMVSEFWRMFADWEPVAEGIAPRLGVHRKVLRRWMDAQGLPKGRAALRHARSAAAISRNTMTDVLQKAGRGGVASASTAALTSDPSAEDQRMAEPIIPRNPSGFTPEICRLDNFGRSSPK